MHEAKGHSSFVMEGFSTKPSCYRSKWTIGIGGYSFEDDSGVLPGGSLGRKKVDHSLNRGYDHMLEQRDRGHSQRC